MRKLPSPATPKAAHQRWISNLLCLIWLDRLLKCWDPSFTSWCLLFPVSPFPEQGLWSLTDACVSRYVVRNQIHVDHGSLCHLLDRLCGLFSLSIAHQSRGLHNVILPRSWFHDLGEDFNNLKSQDSRSYELVVDSIQQLLEDVYRGSFTRGMVFYFRIKWKRLHLRIRSIQQILPRSSVSS